MWLRIKKVFQVDLTVCGWEVVVFFIMPVKTTGIIKKKHTTKCCF